MKELNKIERLKAKCTPADFLARIDNVDWYAPSEADRFYLKNYGIYNIKLRPERWMLRLRFDGGRIDAKRLRYLGDLALRERLRPLLTARGQIELHDISPKRILPLWRECGERGLLSWQTLTDNFRALVTDPLSDCAPDARIDTFALLDAIRERFLARPEWLGTLPRKFNTALIGREIPSFNPWGNDLLFALAEKEGRWGFNLYLGGKNSETAQDADIFCLPEHVADLFESVARVYKIHGYRGSRSKTRLFHLIQKVGMPQLREWIARDFDRPLETAGAPKMQSSIHNRDRLLPIRRFGRHGEIDPQTLLKIADAAETRSRQLRLTPHQELWIFNPKIIQNPKSKIQNPASDRGGITACAGLRYCPLSLWDIKKDLEFLPMKRLESLGVSLGFSGCLKGCGRHYHSDLGLIGLRTNLYAETERAARIFLGALQAPDPAPGRLLYYSVPLRGLSALIHAILDSYEASGRESFEAFSRHTLWLYSTEFLQLWFVAAQLYDLCDLYDSFFRGEAESALLTRLEKIDGEERPVDEWIRTLTHRLWDLKAS